MIKYCILFIFVSGILSHDLDIIRECNSKGKITLLFNFTKIKCEIIK